MKSIQELLNKWISSVVSFTRSAYLPLFESYVDKEKQESVKSSGDDVFTQIEKLAVFRYLKKISKKYILYL